MAQTEQYYSTMNMSQLKALAAIRGVSPEGTSNATVRRLKAQDKETVTSPSAGAPTVESAEKPASPSTSKDAPTSAEDKTATDNDAGWQTVGKDKKSKPAVQNSSVSAEQDKATRAANLARAQPRDMDDLFQEWNKSIGYVPGTVYKSEASENTDAGELEANATENATKKRDVSPSTNVEAKSTSSSTPAASEVETGSHAGSAVTPITDEEGFTLVPK
jgi:hypothetical protein